MRESEIRYHKEEGVSASVGIEEVIQSLPQIWQFMQNCIHILNHLIALIDM